MTDVDGRSVFQYCVCCSGGSVKNTRSFGHFDAPVATANDNGNENDNGSDDDDRPTRAIGTERKSVPKAERVANGWQRRSLRLIFC